MSEMYQSFQEDFCKYLNNIQKKTQAFTTQSRELKELALNEGANEIREAEKCVISK